MSNAFEQSARAIKALKLESALLLAWERIPAADRAGLSLADTLEGPDAPALWDRAVWEASVKPPSDATKALVIAGLRRREAIMTDPFAGIGPADIGPVTLRRVGL
jgi:hypothetical protein